MKGLLLRALRFILHGVRPVNVLVERYPEGLLLKDKKIFVTGGSKGIGFAIANLCIKEGATVVICGRNESALRDAVIALGEKCKYIVGDIADTHNIKALIDEADSMVGGLDCLVNNAGISFHEKDYKAVTIEGFDEQMSVNLKGAYFAAKYFLEKAESRNSLKDKNILFISSERGSFQTDIPYGLSKAMINSLIGGLNNRIAKYGCRVNAIAPGVTATPMTGRENCDDMSYSGSPSGRVLMPEEIASVAVFMLSDRSSCISGEVINCDYGSHHKTY